MPGRLPARRHRGVCRRTAGPTAPAAGGRSVSAGRYGTSHSMADVALRTEPEGPHLFQAPFAGVSPTPRTTRGPRTAAVLDRTAERLRLTVTAPRGTAAPPLAEIAVETRHAHERERLQPPAGRTDGPVGSARPAGIRTQPCHAQARRDHGATCPSDVRASRRTTAHGRTDTPRYAEPVDQAGLLRGRGTLDCLLTRRRAAVRLGSMPRRRALRGTYGPAKPAIAWGSALRGGAGRRVKAAGGDQVGGAVGQPVRQAHHRHPTGINGLSQRP